MIVVTGAGGFIGSCLISYLNRKGHEGIIAVDALQKKQHFNLTDKKILEYIDREIFIDWFSKHYADIEFVFHIGARTDTAERSEVLFDALNVNYSKSIWNICSINNIPLIYASSAATYGDGSLGYSDDHGTINGLKPLNPYGWSKQKFDMWVLEQKSSPPFWAGFKFFNVFGPNEYHKGRMASVIMHAFNQIKDHGKVKLFRSNDPNIADGKQRRDFIYVMDLLEVLYFFSSNRPPHGIYNLGSGVANTFLDLAINVFRAMGKDPHIEFIPMPEDLANSYQNYTCADMGKLRRSGYPASFHSFEKGISDYVCNYLVQGLYY